MDGFKLIKAPNGVRVFYQKVPGVKFVSIELAIFSGSMDDREAGGEGIMHWLEHVPFKGTARYPKGRVQICEPFQRFAGRIGACTNKTQTCYYARVPSHLWKEALNVLVSLFSEPLLTEQSIEEERRVIESEISMRNSQYPRFKNNEISRIIAGDHPWSKPTLGTKESLYAVTPANLRLAHQRMYDRGRAVLIIAGDITETDTAIMTEKLERLPKNNLSPRLYPTSYGQINPSNHNVVTIDAPFAASTVIALWPIAPLAQEFRQKNELVMGRINFGLSSGGLSSPLMRILREERQLVYGASADSFNIGIDGGFLCIEAETANQKNIEKVTMGIFDALADSQTTSDNWYQFVTDQIIGSTAMLTIDPARMTDSMLDEISLGADNVFTSSEEAAQALAEISHHEYLEMLSNFSRENAKIIIFKGTEK